MKHAEKEEMLEAILEDLLPVIETLEAPARKAGLLEEWNTLRDNAMDFHAALKEIM